MKTTLWKLFWDIFAVIIGFYFGYKTFMLSGKYIPLFGYVPIGIIFGVIILYFGVYLVHYLEFLVCWVVYKLSKVKMEEDLPFG